MNSLQKASQSIGSNVDLLSFENAWSENKNHVSPFLSLSSVFDFIVEIPQLKFIVNNY